MSAVMGDGADLERGLTALSQRFGRVSAQIAEAGQALIDHHSLPEEALVQEILAVRGQFESLRARTLEVAAALSVQLAGPVRGLAELDGAVRAVLAESTGRVRRAREEQAARREAKSEARRPAEEDSTRGAEDEARRKADEGRRRATEEAKRKADDEATARRKEEGAKRKAEDDARQKAEAEARRKAEDEAKRKALEEEARRRSEEDARQKAEAEARRKAEDEAKRKALEEARRRSEADARQKAEAEARRKAEDEAKRKALEEEARRRSEEDARQKAEAEARRKAEDEAKRKALEEARRRSEEDARQKAEAEARRKAEDEAKRKALEEARRRSADEARQKTDAEARLKAEEEAKRKAAEEAKRKAENEAKQKAEAEARRKAEEDAKRKAGESARPKPPDEAKGETDGEEAKRKAGEDIKRKVEEARRKLEEVKRRVETTPAAAAGGSSGTAGLETAQWWMSASAAWGNLKSRQVRFADAVRDVLGKYAYVFSVPVQTSADYEDGLLAYGFAVLLDHVDQQVSGFVGEALNRLPARQGATLGRRLYDYLATPLKTRYPDFVKAVMEAGLPKPGLWVNGGIDETETETIVFQRPSMQIGDPDQKAERITQDRLRFIDHHFSVSIPPLTARFVRVQAADLKEAREVEIRTAEKGAPSDQAWIAVLGPRDMTPQVRRHDRQGSRVSGLGRDCASVWVGLFNADPESDRRVELAVTLRRKGQTASPFRRR